MTEITEIVVVPEWHQTHYYITMTECEHCYSLQPCISGSEKYRCVDWHACQQRQKENHNPEAIPALLTPADQAGLIELVEIQRGTIERLKRIEAAAKVYAQAYEAFTHTTGHHAPIMHLFHDVEAASTALIALVKESK